MDWWNELSWVTRMYLSSAAGGVLGVFWPSIVGLFKAVRPGYLGVGALNPIVQFLAFLIVGSVIGAGVAALGFATFMGDAENQKELMDLGTIAYFAALTYGFAAGSLFEEPLKA